MLPAHVQPPQGLPIWTTTVVVLIVLSVMMFRPRAEAAATLREGLGGPIAVKTLPM